jgi:hypothetical protein
MPAFKIESNMPIILLIIVIALISLFFFLDLKKVKLQLDELEEKNNTVMKEIDNIHMQLHKFFSRMLQRIIPRENMPRQNMPRQNMPGQNMPRQNIPRQNIPGENMPKINNSVAKVSNVNNSPDLRNSDNITSHDFDKLKKQPVNNDIFSEVKEVVSDNNDVPLPNLEPVVYDDNKKYPEDDQEDDPEDSEVDDLNSDSDDNSDSGSDNLNMDDLSEEESNKLELYMNMSVKDLKSKCIEMNLKHSGNKSVLAKRIVDNLS